MKTKMLAACTLAVITLGVFSCNLFSKSSKAPTLVGQWKVTAIDDSTRQGKSFFNGFNPDTARVEVRFITDSTLSLSSAGKPAEDTAIYHLAKDNTSIIVRADNDSKYDTFAVKVLTDTLLRVSQDSIYFQLAKQP